LESVWFKLAVVQQKITYKLEDVNIPMVLAMGHYVMVHLD
jgi:hypothetical protein